MVHLTATGRTRLASAIRVYLESVPNIHSIKDIYYIRNTDYVTSFISKTFCSSARFPQGQTYTLELHSTGYHDGTAEDQAIIDSFQLTDEHAASIQHTLQRKRGVSVIHLTILWYDDEGEHGHSCLLVFNARSKKQHFFDPNGCKDQWMVRKFEGKTLVEGFRPASRHEDSWPVQQDSMQRTLDQNLHNVGDNCSLYCVLVAVLCTRFGMGKPKLIGNLVAEAMTQIDLDNNYSYDFENPAHSHISRLWNWMNSLSDVAARLQRTPELQPGDAITESMVDMRNLRRQEALGILADYPVLQGPPFNTEMRVQRRNNLRQRNWQYLHTHPVLQLGQPVTNETIAEDRRMRLWAESELVRLMFPPSLHCNVLVRTGELCSRRACGGQPLCWQHRYYTRNHVLTGAGRMRCAAVQQPC